MFLSVVILGRFTTETHAMALYISTDTPPLFTPRPGTFPRELLIDESLITRLGGLLDPISSIGIRR